MKRSPPNRTDSLRRTSSLKRGGRLKPQSDKRRQQQAIRRDLATPFRGEPCALALPGCTGRAEHWHELVGAAQGGSRTDPRNLVPACDACNGLVEDTPFQAYARGLKVPRREAIPGDDGLIPLHPNPYAIANREVWT